MRFLPLCTLFAVLSAPLSAQSGVLDQNSPFGNASFNTDSTTLTWQQQVRVGVGGTLEGLTFEMYSPAPGSVDVSVRLGAGWTTNPVLWQGTAATVGLGAGVWETVYVDCLSAGIVLNANDLFVIELTGTGSGVWARGDFVAPPGIPSYPEPLYLNGGPGVYAGGGWTIGFQTWMVTGPASPALSLIGTCPGPATILCQNMTPGGQVYIGYGATLGAWTIPSGSCAGAVVPLVAPTLLFVATADAIGDVVIPGVIPPQACGVINLLGFDVSGCLATNPLLL